MNTYTRAAITNNFVRPLNVGFIIFNGQLDKQKIYEKSIFERNYTASIINKLANKQRKKGKRKANEQSCVHSPTQHLYSQQLTLYMPIEM